MSINIWKRKAHLFADGYTDIHSHILPGIDDGPPDIETAKQMLRIANESGTRRMIATPHYFPERYSYSKEIYEEKCLLLTELAKEVSPQISLYFGSEVYYSSSLLSNLINEQVPVLNGTNVLLLEFMPFQGFNYIKSGIQEIQLAGYQIILAHPERYLCFMDQTEAIEDIYAMGVKLQVNAGSITGANGKVMKRAVHKWLKKRLVDFVSSDAHGIRHRTPDLSQGAEIVRRKYGREYMDLIFTRHAQNMLL
ncbi:MAG: CpsB/CapC family capsule biosynthesis tyrosine phosphatase [Lachnospiraceae bacterium]